MEKPWGALALVVMIVADVVLVAWALGLVGGGWGGDAERPERPAASSPSTSSSPTSSPSATEGAGDGTVVLDAVDAKHGLRAVHEPCTTKGDASVEIERTDDGGQTWSTTTLPVRSVLRVRLTSAAEGFAVVADDDCEPKVVSTSDGGETWGEPGPAATTWGLWPEQGPQVLVPGGEPAEACEEGDATAISATDGRTALVLCDGGTVRRTSDAGKTWTDAATVEGAVSLSARDDVVAVLVDADECEGLGVRSGETGEELTLGEPACVEGVSAPAAITVTGAGGWVADEGAVAVGEDLRLWSAASPVSE